jgi:hypothetical protein
MPNVRSPDRSTKEIDIFYPATLHSGTMEKINWTPLKVVDGLKIFINRKPAKGSGKNRIWIQIRQGKPKQWRVYETLAYARSVDIQFVEDKE